MKGLIDLCIKRPVSVIMFLAALFLGGIFSFTVLPVQRLPEFPFPRVTVETLYPGLGAEDIRSSVTIPVEDALSSVKGLERIRSISRDGASLTVLDFRWGTDSGAASILVREAIDAVYPSLPEGSLKPTVIPGNPDEQAQLIIAIRSPLGLVFARNCAEYELRSMFRRIDGVGKVILSGGEKEELSLKVDMPRALSRGLPPAVLAEILSSETANIPAGNAREGDKELVVVSQGKPETETELGKLIFPSQNGSFIIGDIGSLGRTTAKKESVFIASGKNKQSGDVFSNEYASLEIFRRPGADPLKLSRELRKAVEEASSLYSRDIEIRIIYDDADSILPGIQQLCVTVILGTLAVMVVLFFNLRSLRYSILAGVSLPLSMAASIIALAATGRTINTMSLVGIAMGIGLVSDTSVIILDLLHHGFKGKEKPQSDELGALAASVASSSFGGTATTAVVFIPVVFLPGPLGSLFGDLSIALVASILTGWIYAQLALPSLFSFFFVKFSEKKSRIRINTHDSVHVDTIVRSYTPLLKYCVQHPFKVMWTTVLVCVLGFAFLFTRPFGFISVDAAREIEVVMNFPPGTVMESIAYKAAVLGEELASLPGIAHVFGRAGSEKEDSAKRSNPLFRKETFIFRCVFDSGKHVKPALVLASVNSVLEKKPYETFARFPQDETEKLLGLSSSAVIVAKGKNIGEAENRAHKAENIIRKEEFNVTLWPLDSRPEIRVTPDREALAHAGITTTEAAIALYAAVEGLEAGELELEGKPLAIKLSALDYLKGFRPALSAESGHSEVAGPEQLNGIVQQLEALPVVFRDHSPVFAGNIVRFILRETSGALARLDRSDVLYIESSFSGYEKTRRGNDRTLNSILDSLCSVSEGGEREFTRASESVFARYRSSLVLTVVLVIMLLYLVIGAEFESLSLPLILLLAIPFSLAGAGPALALSGAGLDSSSILALLVLFGLSVNNGMILYELAAEKYTQGIKAADAVCEAALERLRPVLTTTLTTVFALLPLALNSSGNKEQSMAAAMLGGLTACTLLTLFALPPVLIRFFYKRKRTQ